VQRKFVPADAKEEALVAELRLHPRDAESRSVYADWLEQNGHARRAKFLRLEDSADEPDVIEFHLQYVSPPEDVAWRAIVSRPRMGKCADPMKSCTARWDTLAPMEDDNIRSCGTCEKSVHYCTSIRQAQHHAARSEAIVVDAGLVRQEVLDAYNIAFALANNPFEYGPTRNPPAPGRYDEDDGDGRSILSRFFGWFRR
jgi:uncharacterized protein (TIGR02996 family)